MDCVKTVGRKNYASDFDAWEPCIDLQTGSDKRDTSFQFFKANYDWVHGRRYQGDFLKISRLLESRRSRTRLTQDEESFLAYLKRAEQMKSREPSKVKSQEP
jgi:hypothetical protein